MTVNVLGLSAFYHDSAAVIVQDGAVVAAAQEERFSRKKHDPRFPRRAINYCIGEAFIENDELDAVVFYDHPLLTLDRVLKSLLTVSPLGEEQWLKAAPSILGVKIHVAHYIREMLNVDVPIMFTRHHLAHAASAFYPSPFQEAAILTLDGVGEWATTSIAKGSDDSITVLKEIHYPHSLGLLYSAFTYFCGFKVNSGEYKLMGLAPYGRPRYVDAIRQHLIHTRPDGSFRLNMKYFGYLNSNKMTNEHFDKLFGGPPRGPESSITRRECDLAASVQKVTEEVVLGLARHAKDATHANNLVLAGGVALNCVANGLLLRERIFNKIWVQPAAGDAGGAMGAALMASYRRFGVTRKVVHGCDGLSGSYLGPSFSSSEVRAFLDSHGYPYEVVTESKSRARRIALALNEGQIVGHFSGRMEFGPRALGARSILGDPRNAETQVLMNLKIKYRESFRPFAPTVLAERCLDYFEMSEASPYMLMVAPVRQQRRIPMDFGNLDNSDHDLLTIVKQARSDIPAVTHVDYSARIQTIRKRDHPNYYDVLKSFEELTGCGVIVNTSFNVRGEPIVCTPQDAYRCFMRTGMDLLVMEDYLLFKSSQPATSNDGDWRKEYELD